MCAWLQDLGHKVADVRVKATVDAIDAYRAPCGARARGSLGAQRFRRLDAKPTTCGTCGSEQTDDEY